MTQFAMKLNVNCYIASKTGINIIKYSILLMQSFFVVV